MSSTHCVLYYSESSQYQSSLNTISDLFRLLQQRWKLNCTMIELSSLSPSEIEIIKSGVRSIPPQVRGRIVTSQGQVLPFSKTKNLNLKNTPLLVLYRDKTAVDVYPHVLGSKYYDVLNTLERILRLGPDDYLQLRGLLEDPIVKILSDFPEILGLGTSSLGSEVPVQTGIIDLLMKDREGRIMIVEIETAAGDIAVSQACRLAAGYSSLFNVPQDQIRKVIVCLKHSSTLADACKGAGVELFQLTLKPIQETSHHST